MIEIPLHELRALVEKNRNATDFAAVAIEQAAAQMHSVNYTRYRSDGSASGDYDSLYVLALKDDRWGVQLRSSVGP